MSTSSSSSKNQDGEKDVPRGRSNFGLKKTSTASNSNVGVGVFSHSTSSSISQNQRNNAMSLVPAQPKLSRTSKSGGGGGAGNSESEDILVKDIITTVFFKKENSERIKRNIEILNESRYEKMFVTFNGGDIKKPDGKLEIDMKATFGDAGWELYKMLLRIVNILLFQDVHGIFQPLTWNGKLLLKKERGVNSQGRVIYEPAEVLDPNEDDFSYRAIGSSLLNTICPPEADDTEHYSISLNSSKMDYNELMMLLRGVETPIMVRKAFRLMLLFVRCSYDDIKNLPRMDNISRGLCHGTTHDHIRNCHYAYLQSVVDIDEKCLSTFKAKAYGSNYFNILQRYSKSINYHVRDWLQSIQRILVGRWGEGSGRGIGLWGIHPRQRPEMLLHNHEFNGYSNPSNSDNEPITDKLIQLPCFKAVYCKKLLEENFIEKERLDIEVNAMKDMVLSTWKVQEEMMTALDEPGEDGLLIWKDEFTPAYYERMQRLTIQDPFEFISFWQLQMRFITAVGIGALYDKRGIDNLQQPPYTLSQAMIDSISDTDLTWYPESCKLVILRKSTASRDTTVIRPATNEYLDPTNDFYLPVDTSIFMDFLMEVRKLYHLRNFKTLNVDTVTDEIICPSIDEIEQGIGEENMERFMVGAKNGSILKRLETHSIVMMLMLAVWNEELCCVPLHTLNGFEEFFEFFSLEYLARTLAIMCIGSQFPLSPIWKMISDVAPTSTMRLHGKMFTDNTIDPDVVTAIYILLKQDKNSMLSLDLWEQLYILRVLCILVPKPSFNVVGFGKQKLSVGRGVGGGGSSSGGKRKKSNTSNNEEEEDEIDNQRIRKNSKASNTQKSKVVKTTTTVAAEYTEKPKKKLTAKEKKAKKNARDLYEEEDEEEFDDTESNATGHSEMERETMRKIEDEEKEDSDIDEEEEDNNDDEVMNKSKRKKPLPKAVPVGGGNTYNESEGEGDGDDNGDNNDDEQSPSSVTTTVKAKGKRGPLAKASPIHTSRGIGGDIAARSGRGKGKGKEGKRTKTGALDDIAEEEEEDGEYDGSGVVTAKIGLGTQLQEDIATAVAESLQSGDVVGKGSKKVASSSSSSNSKGLGGTVVASSRAKMMLDALKLVPPPASLDPVEPATSSSSSSSSSAGTKKPSGRRGT